MITIKNNELINKIEKIMGNVPVTLIYNTKARSFFGYCCTSGHVFNTFHVSIKGNICEISNELIEDKKRREFFSWFNSYGGNEMFFKEAQKHISNVDI